MSYHRRPRRWQALLIFGPLLFLTAIGISGLQATRRAARETVRTQVAHYTELVLAELETGMAWAARTPRAAPLLYPSSPVPAEPNEAQALYDQALGSSATEIDALLARIETSFPNASAQSGLPLLPLVKWARLERANPTAMLPEKAAGAGAEIAVESHPSALSRELLERGRGTALEEHSLGSPWHGRRGGSVGTKTKRREPCCALMKKP